MVKPNYIKCQLGAFKILYSNQNIKKKEISLYMALFILWNRTHFQYEISATRKELRKNSKIGSNEYLLIAFDNLQSAGILTVIEKSYQFESVRVIMTRCFEDNDMPSDSKITPEHTNNDTLHSTSGTRVVPLLTPFIKKENLIENNFKKEKKENEFEMVKNEYQEFFNRK